MGNEPPSVMAEEIIVDDPCETVVSPVILIEGDAEITSVVIELLFTVAGFAQTALLVREAVIISPSINVLLL